MISSIVLAAGLSTRFGSPKPLAKVGVEPIIVRVQKTLLSSPVDEIIVVLGAAAEDVRPFLLKHEKVKVVYNKDYKLGQTVSFQSGLAAVNRSSQGFLLLPVDYPLVQSSTIAGLVEEFFLRKPAVIIPAYQGRRGHPPIFNFRLQKELKALGPNQGLNQIAAQCANTLFFPTDDSGVILTFNTVAEFESLKAVSYREKTPQME